MKESSTDLVLVLDFGAQYAQLIARRVREARVYCEIAAYSVSAEAVASRKPRALILSGGPASVYEERAPGVDPKIYELGIPILGICYGMQLMARDLGGAVSPHVSREFGKCSLAIGESASPLFEGVSPATQCWMSHGDTVLQPPPGFKVLASSANTPVAAMGDEERNLYGVQFHPEVVHTPEGSRIISNFLYKIAGCRGDWTAESFVDQAVRSIRQQIGEGKAVCALSGGVDSTVAAVLVHRAIGDALTCVFVDHGLLRKGEAEEVVGVLSNKLGMKLVTVDASERFLAKLKGVEDPEQKRKIIGTEFIRIFEDEAARIQDVKYLVQGTLYPDVIESGTGSKAGAAAVIKSHHNVGGLPSDMRLELVEPLRQLFKDEVRRVGLVLGLPEEVVYRQPFPGPGLAVRIIGEVDREKLKTLREADAIVREEIGKAGLSRSIWQYFAVLTDLRSVGVMGDKRTYGRMVAVRAITSEDGMTADWARLPDAVLERIASRIVNEVHGVNRVVYDITSKPPATIEWE
ncbi:MAG TPA: glutamine-hydrolyzing GMP synthase [Firmicutes bacterium]|nr:glutamine-hydrolyzing GMP synthase [Bacillota bacterium]